MAYDSTNLYIRYECAEKSDHIITAYGAKRGKPWESDGVELLLARPDNPELGFHAIVDVSNAVFAEITPMVNSPGKTRITLDKTALTSQAELGKTFWTMTLTVPWKEIGGFPGTGKKIAFNLMRNRTENGQIGDYSLSADGKYFSGDKCLLQLQ